MHTNQVHGEPLFTLVHSGTQDALDRRRVVDLLHVLIGDENSFEDDVAKFAVCAVIAKADYRVLILIVGSNVGGGCIPEVGVCKCRRKGEQFTCISTPTSRSNMNMGLM